mgnify:CR=1 FL=1
MTCIRDGTGLPAMLRIALLAGDADGIVKAEGQREFKRKGAEGGEINHRWTLITDGRGAGDRYSPPFTGHPYVDPLSRDIGECLILVWSDRKSFTGGGGQGYGVRFTR